MCRGTLYLQDSVVDHVTLPLFRNGKVRENFHILYLLLKNCRTRQILLYGIFNTNKIIQSPPEFGFQCSLGFSNPLAENNIRYIYIIYFKVA